jgi:ribosome-associated protein
MTLETRHSNPTSPELYSTLQSVTVLAPTKTAPAPRNAPLGRALVDRIVEAIREKKGSGIAVFDLRRIDGAFTDYFVFCSGRSDTQNSAISGEIQKQTREHLRERPNHVEGEQVGEWVLLDYIDVVVHVMLPRVRDHYRLEELWADADVQDLPDEV